MRLREWTFMGLVGAAAFLYDLFLRIHPIFHTLSGVSLFSYRVELLQSHQPLSLCRSFFRFIGFCLGTSRTDLTAPVTHQDLGLQKNGIFPSAAPSVVNGPENLRFQAVSNAYLTRSVVISQTLMAHGVGGQDGDDLVRWGWNG